MTSQTPKPKHHHGNLRQALVTAGLELLEEGGLDALTLRKCAARAGVSHAAPAHHFDGLPGLKEAIAEEGFRIFTKYLQDYATRASAPTDRLHMLAKGYLQFGLDHAGILKIMFGNGLAALRPDNREEAQAYLVLREVCAPFVAPGQSSAGVELQVWSLIHGFTMLYVEGEFGMPPPPIPQGPFQQVMTLLDHIGTPPAS